MKDTLFIINPASARGATLRAWTAARPLITALGLDFYEHMTSRAGEATEVAREALRRGVARIVSVGGDGTLNEVVNGYFDDQCRPINSGSAIGLLPSGTGSDFGRSIGLTSRSKAIRGLVSTETRLIDAGYAEFIGLDGKPASRVFINVASFGLGGDVSALVNSWRGTLPRWIGGRTRFAAAAVAKLGSCKNVAVSLALDQREIQVNSNFIVAGNGRFAGGGMMLAPNSELDDGLLDVIITDNLSRFDVIRELPRIQRGAHLRHSKVTAVRARVVSIDSAVPLAVDLDGEMLGFTPARLRVLPLALRLLTNSDKK